MTGLSSAIALVERQVAAMGKVSAGFSTHRYSEWAARRRATADAVETALVAAGATIKEDWRGATMKLAGIRATSTCGLDGALNNWLVAARRQLAKGEAAHG